MQVRAASGLERRCLSAETGDVATRGRHRAYPDDEERQNLQKKDPVIVLQINRKGSRNILTTLRAKYEYWFRIS